MPDAARKVLWAELFPDELLSLLEEAPVVYLPMGLCEPHGHTAALGLDTLKAEGLCCEAARRFGGVVAPTQGYHIHETGYHARWLEDSVGQVNPRMTSLPPTVLLQLFLYQLRAFHNAGFKSAIVLSGHAGGNERDLRLAAEAFMSCCPLRVVAVADSELVSGKFEGDHAGKYELSQLLALRPDLVDPARPRDAALGGFAQGDDAARASAEHGREIIEATMTRLEQIVSELRRGWAAAPPFARMTNHEVEAIWIELQRSVSQWTTAAPYPSQQPVSAASQWKAEEYLTR